MFVIFLFIFIMLIFSLIFVSLNKPIIKSETTKIIRQPIDITKIKVENSLDRIYNPLRYPEKSLPYFNYPNLNLPADVVGLGGRMQPGFGGSQLTIFNPTMPLNVSNTNIAPINIRTRGPEGMPEQVGVIQKVFGDENDILPLFGRKKYPRDDRWEYYTMIGKYGVKMPVITKYDFELGNNDVVKIQNQKDDYRVTIYNYDSPKYIPYY